MIFNIRAKSAKIIHELKSKRLVSYNIENRLKIFEWRDSCNCWTLKHWKHYNSMFQCWMFFHRILRWMDFYVSTGKWIWTQHKLKERRFSHRIHPPSCWSSYRNSSRTLLMKNEHKEKSLFWSFYIIWWTFEIWLPHRVVKFILNLFKKKQELNTNANLINSTYWQYRFQIKIN